MFLFWPNCPAANLIALRKMRLEGKLTPTGKNDWTLQARLGATVVQTCVVSLDPVSTRIEEPVDRLYTNALPELADPDDAGEVESPEDDHIEPLPSQIDLASLATEALALAVPMYPRAEGAVLADANFTEPGKTAMRDEDTRPFAGLAGLKDQLEGKKSDQ